MRYQTPPHSEVLALRVRGQTTSAQRQVFGGDGAPPTWHLCSRFNVSPVPGSVSLWETLAHGAVEVDHTRSYGLCTTFFSTRPDSGSRTLACGFGDRRATVTLIRQRGGEEGTRTLNLRLARALLSH